MRKINNTIIVDQENYKWPHIWPFSTGSLDEKSTNDTAVQSACGHTNRDGTQQPERRFGADRQYQPEDGGDYYGRAHCRRPTATGRPGREQRAPTFAPLTAAAVCITLLPLLLLLFSVHATAFALVVVVVFVLVFFVVVHVVRVFVVPGPHQKRGREQRSKQPEPHGRRKVTT